MDKSVAMAKPIPSPTSFHDREDIRRRLAFDSDSEDISVTTGFRSSRKSSLLTRLQSGQNLQICFMNETINDSLNHSTDGPNNKVDNESRTGNNLDNFVSNKCKISPNNNSCLDITDSFGSINISKSSSKRPNHLFTKLGFNSLESLDLDKNQLFSKIEKPSKKEMFVEYHSRLHAEARLALAQVKEIVNKQIELERHRNRIRSPVYSMINIPNRYKYRKNKLSRTVISGLNVSQLQIIVNDMFSQIENLNGELVQLLVKRDELYMEQDSVLVDIEDLTIFLCSKEVH